MLTIMINNRLKRVNLGDVLTIGKLMLHLKEKNRTKKEKLQRLFKQSSNHSQNNRSMRSINKKKKVRRMRKHPNNMFKNLHKKRQQKLNLLRRNNSDREDQKMFK